MISQLSVTIALVASTIAAPALLSRPGHSDNFFAIHRRAASAEVQKQNGLTAQVQNKAFAALNANSSCTIGSASRITPSPVASAQGDADSSTTTITLDFPGETLSGFLTPDQIESIFSSLSASAAASRLMQTKLLPPRVQTCLLLVHKVSVRCTCPDSFCSRPQTGCYHHLGQAGDPGFLTPDQVASFLSSQAAEASATFVPSSCAHKS
ncbi:hypothetical protein BDP27DRAFT_720525 [Rhodocollybia butyracea]|uniref:Uncharacterized protein n=1 Tax=Rhodocollybia butyracea TaxID=206335 RepID=A0A9P5U912_9AGAR|nr:hypothetical protein BDP27DRAFT_720525 [Rhodocollybia butyracea]